MYILIKIQIFTTTYCTSYKKEVGLLLQTEAAASQTGRSFSTLGGIRRIGLLSKKLTGFRSKLDETVGITGKSS